MILIINSGTSWLRQIKKNVADQGHQYKIVNINNLSKCNLKLFSGIIISGAPILLTQVDLKKFLQSFKFIKTIKVPVLGICLGHQIIGLLYCSQIKRGMLVNKNEYIMIVKRDKLFSDVKNNAFFQEEHSEYINLPKQFRLLAKSNSCDNEAMKHKQKNIYGVQFHPEVSKKNGRHIFRNFLELCSNADSIA